MPQFNRVTPRAARAAQQMKQSTAALGLKAPFEENTSVAYEAGYTTAVDGALPRMPGELFEYSVVYSDRAVNHMSATFVHAMQDIIAGLKEVYGAHTVAVVPGSGSFGMESVARQFATGRKAMVLRNGFFSFRWTQILEMGGISPEVVVLKGQPTDTSDTPQFTPHPIEDVVASIRRERPAVVFAPHVETSAGIILPDDYIKAVADAAHEVGALFLLDCIASGAVWADMPSLGVDILLSAPQKGWTGSPCAGLVMLSEEARRRLDETESTSFVLNLKTWVGAAETFEQGGHQYHCTMPTMPLIQFAGVVKETREFGWENAKQRQIDLGSSMRRMLSEEFGYKSIAADEFAAPPVLVCYGTPDMPARFKAQNVQIAGGVPLKIDEPSPFNTFRFGFFGLDKLQHPDACVDDLRTALRSM
eukprot:TRINITY_DN9095_c1_g1_i1.p1 TRINITY_DN9095_c1_g1~~TRINITY_DN9095_c1_g1_i1.p1  ORF type:complete len:418 (+),score=152.54 TRINITY_DN9095_c1_g1_i1:67-1320(+)